MTPDEAPDGPLCVDTDVFSYLHLGKGLQVEEFRALIQGHLLVASFATVGKVRALPLKATWEQRRPRARSVSVALFRWSPIT